MYDYLKPYRMHNTLTLDYIMDHTAREISDECTMQEIEETLLIDLDTPIFPLSLLNEIDPAALADKTGRDLIVWALEELAPRHTVFGRPIYISNEDDAELAAALLAEYVAWYLRI